MRHSKQAKTWFWICTRRVNGKKCNSAKFSVRRGTFFDNSKLSIQSILRIVWNFVHHLSEEQCKQFVGISTKTNHTVGEYYRDCRNICNHQYWIRNPRNLPKLGGLMSFSKWMNHTFQVSPNSIEAEDSVRYGMTTISGFSDLSQEDILEQVPSNRSRKTLLPIINKYCLDGTLFCSDGWKAYHCLAAHLDLEDVIHIP